MNGTETIRLNVRKWVYELLTETGLCGGDCCRAAAGSTGRIIRNGQERLLVLVHNAPFAGQRQDGYAWVDAADVETLNLFNRGDE